METMELHRGRLIDHIQLVVKDLAASKRFYVAALGVLGIPMGGETRDFFWADELCVSSQDSEAAQGALTGRTHFAFQARSREMDPDGNNIETVFHGPAQKSAESVKITFSA